jgi:hypothetical protein
LEYTTGPLEIWAKDENCRSTRSHCADNDELIVIVDLMPEASDVPEVRTSSVKLRRAGRESVRTLGVYIQYRMFLDLDREGNAGGAHS